MTGRRRPGGSSGSGQHASPRSHGDRPDAPDSPRRGSGAGGVGTNLDAIDTMASRLDATRSRVDDVGRTLSGVNVGPQSMGVIGSGFTGAAQSHLRHAEQQVARATRAVEQAQAGTAGTAAAYRDTDATSAARLAGVDTTIRPPNPTGAGTAPSAGNTATSSAPSRPQQTHRPGPIASALDGSSGEAGTPPLSNADFVNLPTHRQVDISAAEIGHGARTFRDNDEASRYGADQWNDYTENLPAAQKGALYDYTTDPPHAPSYVDINGVLRGTVPETPQIRQDIEHIDLAMTGHPVPEDIVASRGTNLGHIGTSAPDMVGRTFGDPAYMSTSLGDTAGAFQGKEAVLHLRVPEGPPACTWRRCLHSATASVNCCSGAA